MSITSTHKAFTLIELMLVIAIMGIVATLVSSRLSSITHHGITLTPDTLRSYLGALNSNKRLELFCYANCTQCDLWEGDKKIRTALTLESTTPLSVHRFDHFGRLIPADLAIRSDVEGMRSGCFKFSLTPDGISTPLILKSQRGFIVYTPLLDTPIHGNEEQLRKQLYDTTLTNTGSYYGRR